MKTRPIPGVYGRFQAVVFDFKSFDGWANTGSPAMLDIVGKGYKPRSYKPPRFPPKYPPLPHIQHQIRDGLIDYSYAYMTAPKYERKGVHCPPLIGRSKEREHSHTEHVKGVADGEAELADVVLEWLDDRLNGANARSPVPEIWPAMRIINQGQSQEISLIAPAGATMYYTTDGSEPTLTSTPTLNHLPSVAVPPSKQLAVCRTKKPAVRRLQGLQKGLFRRHSITKSAGYLPLRLANHIHSPLRQITNKHVTGCKVICFLNTRKKWRAPAPRNGMLLDSKQVSSLELPNNLAFIGFKSSFSRKPVPSAEFKIICGKLMARRPPCRNGQQH